MFTPFIKEELTVQGLNNFNEGIYLDKLRTETKEKKIQFLEEKKKANEISNDDINNFIYETIKFQDRRRVYYAQLTADNVDILKDDFFSILQRFESPLPVKEISKYKEGFNLLNHPSTQERDDLKKKTLDIDGLDQSNIDLEYVHSIFANNKLSKSEIILTEIVNHERTIGGQPVKVKKKLYYIIEINFNTRQVHLRMNPLTQAFGKDVGAHKKFRSIIDLLNLQLDSRYLENASRNLYYIYESINSMADKKYIKETKEFVSVNWRTLEDLITESLPDLDDSKYLLFIKERFEDLLSRTLIQRNFKEYMNFNKTKLELLQAMIFQDNQGTTVKAQSHSLENDRLTESDIYFDTKRTIKNKKSVKKLWINWKYNKELYSGSGSFLTKLGYSSDFYFIHYNHISLTEGVENYVLQRIRELSKQI